MSSSKELRNPIWSTMQPLKCTLYTLILEPHTWRSSEKYYVLQQEHPSPRDGHAWIRVHLYHEEDGCDLVGSGINGISVCPGLHHQGQPHEVPLDPLDKEGDEDVDDCMLHAAAKWSQLMREDRSSPWWPTPKKVTKMTKVTTPKWELLRGRGQNLALPQE